MREIKFRAWDNKENKMIPCVFSDYRGANELLTEGKVIPMQFTGLKDKNGREIYEGDIVVVRSLHDGDEGCWNQSIFNAGGEGAIPQAVTWDEQYLCFDFGGCSRIKYAPYDFEVIGNIYEHGELLGPTAREDGGK